MTNNEKRELAANGKVLLTTTRELDRYEPGACFAQYACEDVADAIKSTCKIWTPSNEYGSLMSFECDADDFTGATLADDLAIFQKKLDEAFGAGKYEAFVLGAYIHSGTAFSVNKTGNHVCRWDSSQLGFIGLPVNVHEAYNAKDPDAVARDLTDAWEGYFIEYFVTDNLTGDVVDSIVTADAGGKAFCEWCDNAKTKYGVSFDDVEVLA